MSGESSATGFRQAVVVAAIVAGLCLAIEGSVRVFWPQNLRTEYVSGGSTAVPDEVLGHRLRPNVHTVVRGPEFEVEYRTNAQGLRDEVEHALPAPPDSARILVLGDSFAQGSGNAYEETWAHVLERHLREDGYRVDVVKAGVAGYDTRTEVLYLERIFPRFRPDIVLLTFLPNDLFTNRPIGATAGDHVSPTRGRGKGSRLHSLILTKRLLMASDALYVRLYMMTKRRNYFATPATPVLRRQTKVTTALLDRAHEFCTREGCEFAVLSIPQQVQVIATERMATDHGLGITEIDRSFAGFARERGFPWLAAVDRMRQVYHGDGDDLYHRFDGHLNARGNEVVAAHARQALLEHFAGQLPRPREIPTASVAPGEGLVRAP